MRMCVEEGQADFRLAIEGLPMDVVEAFWLADPFE